MMMMMMPGLMAAETKNFTPGAGRMTPYKLPHLPLPLLLVFSLLLHAPSSVQAASMQQTRRNLKQLANPAPGTSNNMVSQACGATNFPASCLSALNADPRASSAATARDLVSIAIGIAHTHAATAVSDSQSLATEAATANNANLTSISNMCSEELDLASFHTQNSQAAMTRSQLSDVQAWLSGSLTFVTDCNAGLTQVAAALVLIPQMKARLDTTQLMISNALAMTDALVTYGPNTALWKPPAAKTTEQKLRAEAITASMMLPDWIAGSDRKFLEGDLFLGAPSVIVDHKAVGAFSIQHAVDLAPTWSSQRYVIYIKAGVYTENVRIPKHKTNIMFQGDGADKTFITGSLSDSQYGMITWATATVAVSASGFIARGITFENTAGPAARQAVALRINGDQAALQGCSIVGYQDSLYTHSFRQFYKDTYITGTVDFVFGNSAAVFQNCQLVVRAGAPGATTSTLTAQGRTDSSQTTGLVFQDCSITGTPEYVALFNSDRQGHQAFLGRPWKAFSRTVFIRTYIDQIIDPTGWMQWSGNFALNTLFDAEFGSYGPGANMNSRVTWSSQLTTPQAQAFSVSSFIQGSSWLPPSGIPYSP